MKTKTTSIHFPGGVCPNCGACPYCGRATRPYNPYYPWRPRFDPWPSTPIYIGTTDQNTRQNTRVII